MRNLKRALSLTLASVMLLGMMVVGAGAAGYPDVKEDHNVEAIEVLQAVKVMQGNDQGNFDPDSKVNRAQMAVVMANLLKLDYNYYQGTCPFWDVPDWAKPYVAACYANGIVAGYNATTYGAGDDVTAVQAASMMMRALGYFQYQEDYDQNGGFELATVRQASQIGLFDGLGSNATAAMTRNQVAKLTLNALEAKMVNFTGTPGTNIDLGEGKKVNVGYKGEYSPRTSSDRKYSTLDNKVSNIGGTDQYYIELGEELYNGNLTKRSDTDAFQRPATTWRYDYKVIGTYVDEPDLTYTVKKNLGDIYADLGLSASVSTNTTYPLSGHYNDGLQVADLTLTSRDTTNKTGDKGVLTQVWYDDMDTPANNADDKLIITHINTYVAKVNAVNSATSSADRSVTLAPYYAPNARKSTPGAMGNCRFTTEDFVADDLVSYTAAWSSADGYYKIKTVEALTNAASGVLTQWVGTSLNTTVGGSESNFTSGGTKYEYSAMYVAVDPDNAPTDVWNFVVNESELNVYVDKYGYALFVDGVKVDKNYAVVIGKGDVNEYGDNSAGATLLMPDGTKQTVKAEFKTPDPGKAWISGVSNGHVVNDYKGEIVTYRVKSNGNYELTLVGEYKPYTTANSVYFVNGKSDFRLDQDVNGVYTDANDVAAYATSNTIFMVCTNNTDGTKSYNVYTGYNNMPSVASVNKGAAFVTNSRWTNQVDVVYISAPAMAGASGVDTFFVKEKNEAITTENINGSRMSYYTLPAIVDGEKTEIRVDANVPAVDNNGTEYGLFAITNVLKDANGIITGFTDVTNSTTFDWSTGVSRHSTSGTVSGTTGTVARVGDTIGLGYAGSGNPTDWRAFNASTKVYYVDKDYKDIMVSSIEQVATDRNDLVFASSDKSSTVKKLADLIIVAQDEQILSSNTSITGVTVGGVAAVKNASNVWEVVLPKASSNWTTTGGFAVTPAAPTTRLTSVTSVAVPATSYTGTALTSTNSVADSNGDTWTFVVTAEDSTTASYTVKFIEGYSVTVTNNHSGAVRATLNGGTPVTVAASGNATMANNAFAAQNNTLTLRVSGAAAVTVTVTGANVWDNGNGTYDISDVTGPVTVTVTTAP